MYKIAGVLIVVFLVAVIFTSGFTLAIDEKQPETAREQQIQPQENTPSDDQSAEFKEVLMKRIDEQLGERFPDAPQDVHTVARQILSGTRIVDAALAALSPETLNAAFSPASQERWGYGHTLLREAVLARNPEAAQQLILAGADPFFNDNEFPYLAVNWRPNGDLAFPDSTVENTLLRIWLDAEGDPDAHNPAHGRLGRLIVKIPKTNLEGLIILLEAGADPWLSVSIPNPPYADKPGQSFMQSFGLSPVTTEVFFHLARKGLLRPGPPEAMEELAAQLDKSAAFLTEGNGPRDKGDQWRFHRATTALIEATGLAPGPELRKLLSIAPNVLADQAGELAGFWLAPGETRSPDVPTQKVLNHQQNGTELWNE